MASPQHPQADLTAASTSFFLGVSANQARSGIHFVVQVLWHPKTGNSSQQRHPAGARSSTRKLVDTNTAGTPIIYGLGCHGSAVFSAMKCTLMTQSFQRKLTYLTLLHIKYLKERINRLLRHSGKLGNIKNKIY